MKSQYLMPYAYEDIIYDIPATVPNSDSVQCVFHVNYFMKQYSTYPVLLNSSLKFLSYQTILN